MIALFAVVLLTVGAPDASMFIGSPKGTPLRGVALEKRTGEVAALLRCPVCQGMSVADSPAEMAVNMRHQVHDLLARGYTEEQILKYFELSYGQFVLLKPKFEGITLLVWLLPIIAVVIGGLIVITKMKKLEKPTTDNREPTTDNYLAQVRDLVGGEKR